MAVGMRSHSWETKGQGSGSWRSFPDVGEGHPGPGQGMEQQEPRGAPPRSHHNSMGPCMTWLFPGLEEEDVGTAPGPQAGMMCFSPCCRCTRSPSPCSCPPPSHEAGALVSTVTGTAMLWSDAGIRGSWGWLSGPSWGFPAMSRAAGGGGVPVGSWLQAAETTPALLQERSLSVFALVLAPVSLGRRIGSWASQEGRPQSRAAARKFGGGWIFEGMDSVREWAFGIFLILGGGFSFFWIWSAPQPCGRSALLVKVEYRSKFPANTRAALWRGCFFCAFEHFFLI